MSASTSERRLTMRAICIEAPAMPLATTTPVTTASASAWILSERDESESTGECHLAGNGDAD